MIVRHPIDFRLPDVFAMGYDPRFAEELVDEELDRQERERASRKGKAPPKILPPADADFLTQQDIAGSVVTYDDMRKALGKLLQHRGMTQEEINNLAMDTGKNRDLIMSLNEKLNRRLAEEVGADDGSFLPLKNGKWFLPPANERG